jgi:hypothetical protein
MGWIARAGLKPAPTFTEFVCQHSSVYRGFALLAFSRCVFAPLRYVFGRCRDQGMARHAPTAISQAFTFPFPLSPFIFPLGSP